MGIDVNSYDEHTRDILMQGMSVAAAQSAMGLAMGNNELSDTMRKERDDLARDMVSLDHAMQMERARVLAGDAPLDEPVASKSAIEQKPVTRKRKHTMNKQTPVQTKAMKPMHSEQDSGWTDSDKMLVDLVKMKHAQARNGFVDNVGTQHPGAAPTQSALQLPEYMDERYSNPHAPSPAGNPEGFTELDARIAGIQVPQPMQGQPIPPTPDTIDNRNENRGNPNEFRNLLYSVARGGEVAGVSPMNANPGFSMAQPGQTALDGGNTRFTGVRPAEQPISAPDYRLAETSSPAIPAQKVEHVVTEKFNPHRHEADFEQFSEVTGWPSKGLFYPDKVYAQALKSVDAFMLSAADDDDIASDLSVILGRRMRGVSPDDILSADEEYLMYWLRASSYPEGEGGGLPKIKFSCSHCKTNFNTAESVAGMRAISFNDLDFVNVNDPYEIARLHSENGYATCRTYDDRECHIYLRRRKHDAVIRDFINEWESYYRKMVPSYKTLMLSAASVIEIEDCENMSEKLEYLENYPLYEKNDFFKKIAESQVVVETKLNIRCPKCGGTASVPYPFHYRGFVASL